MAKARSIEQINAEIRFLLDKVGVLRAERLVARRRESGIPERKSVAYRSWDAKTLAPVRKDWNDKVPFAEILSKHNLTRGQLMGLRFRFKWPARRETYPEMSARQYHRVRRLAPTLGREKAIATVLQP